MITAVYARTMAAYNAAMNTRFYAAGARLSEEDRRRDRGAFWGSIHGTLSHLIWADRTWMSRFDGWDPPAGTLPQSAALFEDFDLMTRARGADDARLCAWCAALTDDWLAQDQTWYSAAAQSEITAQRTILIAHLFNHQTHHRGQLHAMLTAAGERTGDTDLPLVLAALQRQPI